MNIGNDLRTFSYDQDDNLQAITDQFGNQITIERDAAGVPTAIISADGIRIELTIDVDNQLTRITYPDGKFYNFEYTTGGLMTAEVEPIGNRFDHYFDDSGKLTDVQNQEGGH